MKTLINLVCIVLLSIQIQAQKQKITGTVKDENGLPLPGVNIIVKGTSQGVQTDFDGNYSIYTSKGKILVYSYVGYENEEIEVTNKLIINISLKASAALLEEVIVTAQGIKREKKAIGYAVSSLSSESISNKKRKDINRLLQGKATGVRISSSNGVSGSGTNIIIRGYSSISGNNQNYSFPSKRKKQQTYDRASNNITIGGSSKLSLDKQPLYIVDGVAVNSYYNDLINNIDSKTIEKVNVYKGKKAKELFGYSAKNGCIVITTKSGNYRIENDESYAQIDENKFETTKHSPLSTFSIDVDKASYSNIRRMINNGETIPYDAVKIEEMVNYFNYNYPQPTGEHPFSINTEVATTPWNKDTKLVKIGLQGKSYKNEELPASNLTFLIDVSGSMSSQNKLPLLKSAFKLLVNQLREKDKVSIVVYAGAAGVVLKPTSGNNKETILKALNNLQSGGSTAGGEGIKLAYKLAEKNFKKKGNNRVILATDGDFNVGASSDKDMRQLIEEKRKSGVFLSVLGFGYGNYKDSKLETLADKGNGNHAYIDTMQEAQKVFGKEFGGTLYTIAKDVKIQVEFNPSQVQAYRLIGYENRLLEDEDFIDDTKDAGELGSGHTVTALYEIIPVGVKSKFIDKIPDLKYIKLEPDMDLSDELFTVKFRYKKPDQDKSIEMIHVQNNINQEISDDMKFAASVALFGMQLRNSQFHNNSSINDVLVLAQDSKSIDDEGYKSEFIRLVKAYN